METNYSLFNSQEAKGIPVKMLTIVIQISTK